jgi:hypothetical protein
MGWQEIDGLWRSTMIVVIRINAEARNENLWQTYLTIKSKFFEEGQYFILELKLYQTFF